MRDEKRRVIKQFRINKLMYDFMGYEYNNMNELTFHHLIIPRMLCSQKGFSRGYYEWNCAILSKETSHCYLHFIERFDLDIFEAITSEMIDIKFKGFLDMENLLSIDDLLTCFEREHSSNKDLKEEYTRRLIRK